LLSYQSFEKNEKYILLIWYAIQLLLKLSITSNFVIYYS